MAWGIKHLTEREHAAAMRARDQWLNELWKAFRINLGGNRGYQPQTERESCLATWPHSGATYRAHGGTWDKWEWRGDNERDERAYCRECGQMVRGVLSPWKEAATALWYETRWLKEQQQKRYLESRAKSIKYSKRGRRRIVEVGGITEDESNYLVEYRGYNEDESFGSRKWFGDNRR